MQNKMPNILRNLRRNKPLLFGIYAAIGCLIAAIILGEPFLALTRIAPTATGTAVVLLIDTSGSMGEIVSGDVTPTGQTQTLDGKQYTMVTGGKSKIDVVMESLLKLVNTTKLGGNDRLSIVKFDSNASPIIGLTNPTEKDKLQTAIQELRNIDGGTNMADGIRKAYDQLRYSNLTPNILLFTDGQPDSAEEALKTAQDVRNNNVNLIAVGTGDADIHYLAQLTGDRSLVFYADSGDIDQAFREAEAIIGKELVESAPTGYLSLEYSMLRIGGWTAFLAMGICLSLIIGQNQYMHRPLLTRKKGTISTLGSLSAGMIAGGVSQFLFFSLPEITILQTVSRIIAWVILGTLLGGGTHFFVPNLKLKNALLGGTLGGAMGAIAFLITAIALGDVSGRLSGAVILGFCIGLMIAWIEQKQLSQEPYLLVRWTPTEKTTYLLGATPIIIGSSVDAQIPLNASEGFTPITAKFYKQGENILMEFHPEYAERKNMKKPLQQLQPGDTRKLGNITLEIMSTPIEN